MPKEVKLKSLSDLITDTVFNLRTTGVKIETDYPGNEWGVMLTHFDSCVAVYRYAKVETKDQGLKQKHVSSQAKNENDGDWEAWNKDNPNIPNIPHNPVIFEASRNACAYFADPPPPLRDCLSILTNGGKLSDDDWPSFLLMYGEFRAHLAALHARNPDVDELASRREARRNNKDHLKRYAAKFISVSLNSGQYKKMEDARNSFLGHVIEVVDGQRAPPEGWTKEQFQEFLGEPDHIERRLKAQYGEKLTRPKLEKWL